MCNCGTEIEPTKQFFWRFQFLFDGRENLHDNLYLADTSIISLNYKNLYEFNSKISSQILILTIYYINSSERFKKRDFDPW